MNIKLKIILPVLVLLMIMIPLGVYSAVNDNNLSQNTTNSPIMDNNNLSQNNTKFLNVPEVKQPSNYSSGPTALQAVLSYYGQDTNVDVLINMTNCTPENGTLPGNIANAATKLGFNAAIKENMSLEDLQQNINQGTPVIIDAQAWKNNETNSQNWTDDQVDGHYMVVIGIDSQNVYLEDPAILGSKGYINNQEFLDRWHDTYQDTNGSNITTNHLGIVITGKEPVIRPLILQID
jgi:predicted double-glycine peptidase